MPPKFPTDWQKEASDRVNRVQGGVTGMAAANAAMVRRVLHGMGPDKNDTDPGRGAKVVVNLAAVHVPAFCARNGKAYLNTYDLKLTPSLGSLPSGAAIPTRALVDGILARFAGVKGENIYFGAVDVNGSGIRFYGDLCLVLKRDQIHADTVVLTSNSYDLVRPPVTAAGTSPDANALELVAKSMAGLWKDDTPDMAVLKTMAVRNLAERRLTTGQISNAVLEDEDYLEVLMIESFDTTALQEVRTSAADAAGQAQIGEHLRLGPCPTLAELQWRKHRLAAARALQRRGVHSRVVTTSGRIR